MSNFPTSTVAINDQIITNNANLITALVLNPILLGMITEMDSALGDLTELSTSDQDSLVGAINELFTLIDSISTDIEENFLGVFQSYDALILAHPTTTAGKFAIVLEDESDIEGIFEYQWDADLEIWVKVVGSQVGSLSMTITSDGFNGITNVKFNFDLNDFKIVEAFSGGINLSLGDKYQSQNKVNPTAIELDSLIGNYYDSIVPNQDNSFNYDSEILGGRATVKIDTTGKTDFPIVNFANDIKGKGDHFEEGQIYLMKLECIYVDPIDPRNNRIVYWFEKFAREEFFILERALGDETSDIAVQDDVIRFRMPFDFRLRKVRIYFHNGSGPTGTDATYDFLVSGSSVFGGSFLEISAGSSDSDETDSNESIQPNLFIGDGAECSVNCETIGITNAGQGAKLILYGWKINDRIDESSIAYSLNS